MTKKIAIVYASQSYFKNTKLVADMIKDIYVQNGADVDMMRFEDVPADINFHEYDHVDFGMYTWDNGAIPEEALGMYESINRLLSKDTTTSVFGTGDTFYPNFCGALTIYREELAKHSTFLYTLRIELKPQSSDLPRIEKYAKLNLGIKLQ